MQFWRLRNNRQAKAEQAPLDGRSVGPALVLHLLALAACAAEPRQAWPVYEPPPEAPLDPGLHLDSDLDAGPSVPRATDYPAPREATLWLTADSQPRGLSRWSALAEARAAGGRVLGSLEADVDGDGRRELVTLSRGASDEHLLEVYAPAADRVVSLRRIEPQLHVGRRCHLEVRLIGTLRLGKREAPVLWRDRGVGCARFEGGGYERHLLVEIPSLEKLVELPLASMRNLGPGASDRYEAAVWKVESEAGTSLFLRGIFWARRACSHPDAGFWVEELAYRRLQPDGSVSAWRAGRALSLPAHTLPPELLRSHMAPCRSGPH